MHAVWRLCDVYGVVHECSDLRPALDFLVELLETMKTLE